MSPVGWTKIATLGPVGRLPLAPGTWGSLVGAAAYLGIRGMPWPLAVLTGAAVLALAVYASDRAERALARKDPSEVVIDEFAASWIALAGLTTRLDLVLAFAVFRVFDVTKPFPARWLQDHAPGGWGVVLDDVAVAIYANLAVRGVGLLLGS